MARIAGRNSDFWIAPTSGGKAKPCSAVKSWKLNAQTDYIDVTAMGDTSKQSIAGLPGGSGSFEAFYDDSAYTGDVFTAARDGLARTWYGYLNTGDRTKNYFFGTAFFSADIAPDVAGPVPVSGIFSAATDVCYVGPS